MQAVALQFRSGVQVLRSRMIDVEIAPLAVADVDMLDRFVDGVFTQQRAQRREFRAVARNRFGEAADPDRHVEAQFVPADPDRLLDNAAATVIHLRQHQPPVPVLMAERGYGADLAGVRVDIEQLDGARRVRGLGMRLQSVGQRIAVGVHRRHFSDYRALGNVVRRQFNVRPARSARVPRKLRR